MRFGSIPPVSGGSVVESGSKCVSRPALHEMAAEPRASHSHSLANQTAASDQSTNREAILSSPFLTQARTKKKKKARFGVKHEV